MKQWEIDLRAKLEKELTEGGYEIGGVPGGLIDWTGKGGRINYEVALVKAAKDYTHEGEGLMAQIEKAKYKETGKLTEQDFLDFVEELSKKYNNEK